MKNITNTYYYIISDIDFSLRYRFVENHNEQDYIELINSLDNAINIIKNKNISNSYPVFGYIILFLDLTNLNQNEIQNKGSNILLNINSVSKIKIKAARYEPCFNTPYHIGFCLLNLNDNLTSKDIILLKDIYLSYQNKEHYYSFDSKTSNITIEQYYKKLYEKTKDSYIKLKNHDTNLN